MKPEIPRAIIGGLTGTIVLTVMMYYVAPLMLSGPMDVAGMLGDMMGTGTIPGMIVHFLLGTLVFPLVFATLLWSMLPGGAATKGLIFGIALWLVAELIVMPVAGAGVFHANHPDGMMAAIMSLLGHAVYGLLLGLIGGAGTTARTMPA